MASKRVKNARYLKFLVSTIFIFILIFIPINNQKEGVKNSLFSAVASRVGLIKRPVAQTKIILGGDVMIGRSVMTKALDMGNNIYPFENIKDLLSAADLVYVNLENPIITECPRHYEGFTFCAVPALLEGLVASGVDIVTLANNHTINYGNEGLEETFKHLSDRNIKYTGTGELVIKEINNTKFGFLGFDFLSKKPIDADFELIKNADKQVDVLITSVHWGVEYTLEPTSFQREWAALLVENGADLVVGHHPHWVQSSEKINGVPVYYSLGNLVFDQMWSEKTREGLLVEFTFEGKEIVRATKIKTYMENWAQPEVVK